MGVPGLNDRAKRLLDAIRESAKARADVVPAGWVTAEQAGKHWQIHANQAAKKLKSAGCKVKKFRIATKKRAFPVMHYWIGA